MKKDLNITLDKYIKSCSSNETDYKCNLSHTLLNFLSSNMEDECIIDLFECKDLSFIYNEIFNFFDIRFPNRIKIINY